MIYIWIKSNINQTSIERKNNNNNNNNLKGSNYDFLRLTVLGTKIPHIEVYYLFLLLIDKLILRLTLSSVNHQIQEQLDIIVSSK